MTEYDAFDEIVSMGKAGGRKISQSTGKRVKNLMQLYVASMVVNAVIAAIKSDEFEPLEEAKEGYEEDGILGALLSVVEDYADVSLRFVWLVSQYMQTYNKKSNCHYQKLVIKYTYKSYQQRVIK